MTNRSDGSTAANILRAAIGHMEQRAATYDKPEGERSMGATVAAFQAVTGAAMTEEQGWLFMALLKAVRSQQGSYRADSYEDGAAYFALAGEAAVRDRTVKQSFTTEQHPIHINFVTHTRSPSDPACKVEPAAAIDDESRRMQPILQGGELASEVYSELDRLQAAADFSDDVPMTMREAVALGGRRIGECESCQAFWRACDGSCCVPA